MTDLHYDDDGSLLLGEVKAADLVEKFKTPLYVLDERELHSTCSLYKEAFKDRDIEVKISYASKAFLNQTLCLLLKEEGLGLDVVSGGELYMAYKAGFPLDRIVFNGNNKGEEELSFAIDSSIHRIIVDNLHELEIIHTLSLAKRVNVPILLRINPGIVAHTHHYLETGVIDSKFGLSLRDGSALKAVQRAGEMEYVQLKGLHCHIGSSITDLEPYRKAVQVMNGLRSEVYHKTGDLLLELDLGGGLGVRERDQKIFIEEYASLLLEEIKKTSQKENLPYPSLMIEPGRSIIDTAMTTLYQVGAVKEAGGRRYAIIDGGMSDNIRPALYQATYTAFPERETPEKERVTVVGRCCESADVLIEDILLPSLKRGSILAIPKTGAYTCSMSSNYNGLPRPAMVLLKGREVYEIVRRETWEDLLIRERIPSFLRDDGSTAGERRS